MDQLDRLCRIKEELHLTNDQIAEAAKLPLPTVQKVMSRSTKNPRLQTLMAKGWRSFSWPREKKRKDLRADICLRRTCAPGN